MRRRVFVLGSAAFLAGCSVSDPRIKGSAAPAPGATPPPPFGGAQAVADLETVAEAHLSACAAAPWAGADGDRFRTLAAIRTRHRSVLASPEPLRREAVTVAATSAAPVAPSKEAGLNAAAAALTQLRDACLGHVTQSTNVTAAFWAALAASAAQSISALTVGITPPRPGIPLREVAVEDPAAAATAVLDRYHEAVYGFQSALGFLPARHPSRVALAAMVATAKTQRDDLVAASRAQSATPDPGSGSYSLPPAPDPAAVMSLVERLTTSVAEAAAVWVASAADPDRARAAQSLLKASTLALPLGLGMADYPGWPDRLS